MTIRTKEPEVPSQLPPARLFLDDIEEIVRILRELLESRKLDSPSRGENPKTTVTFSSGGQECDDVQDLPKIAKRHRELRISVTKGRWDSSSLILGPLFTRWESLGLTTEERWSAFHKLQALFQKRNRRWGTLVRTLPPWLRWFVWLAALFSVPFVRFPLYQVMPHGAADVIALLSYAAIVAAGVIGGLNTTFTLRHSWDPPPFLQYMKDKLVPVITGALVGIGGTILGLYLRHKFWP